MTFLGSESEGETGFAFGSVGRVHSDVSVVGEVDTVAEEGVEGVEEFLGFGFEDLGKMVEGDERRRGDKKEKSSGKGGDEESARNSTNEKEIESGTRRVELVRRNRERDKR